MRSKDIRSLIRVAKAQGWAVDTTKGNHVRFTSPAGEVVVTSGTPSDHRVVENVKARLKRRGLRL